MPYGTGATTLQTIPVDPYVIDPVSFFAMTVRDQSRIEQKAGPGFGGNWDLAIPQVGIVQKIRVIAEGTLVVDADGATPTNRWPHGLLKRVRLTANGQNDLHSYDGIDAHVMRFCRFPAYEDAVDEFPGVPGGGPGGNEVDEIDEGTYPIHITWELPVAADESTLVGALFAQSSAANIVLHREQATAAELFGADAANVTLNLTFHTEVVRFEVPVNGEGHLVLPDLTRLHAINATDFQFSGTGDVAVPMIRSAGQLHRLMATVHASSTNRLIPHINAAATERLTALRLQYGGNKRPLDYTPITTLQAQANNWYGSIPPYDAMVLDLIRENPQRDILLMQGVTELQLIPTVGSGVTVSGGLVHMVQQTLFAGG